MSSKKKYNRNEPSLFLDDNPQPANMELREIRMGINKNGEVYRNAIITKTKEYFIEQARLIWGNRYDYNESEYTHGKKPIVIYCPKHDYHFRVAMAQNHIMKERPGFKPTGCPICAAEKLHKCEYGTDWRKHLKLCAKNNRVGRIVQPPSHKAKTPEQIAAEKAEREAKAEAKRREQQAYIKQWQAKDINEARFKERVFQMYGDQYDMTLVDYQGNDHEITLICRHHGLFEIKPRILLVGVSHGGIHKPPHGCWKCCGLQDPREKPVLTAKDFNQKVRRIYQYKPLTFPVKKKISLSANVTATCAKHGKITHKAQWWLDGKGCEYCNGAYHPMDCFDNARKVHGDKYQYIGEPPRTGNGIMHYICPKHGEIEQRYDVHVKQGCGCPKCANYPNKKSPLERCQEWIAKCIEKYGEGRYDYSRAHEDYVNNDSLVWIRCCLHDHWFKTTPDNNLRTVNGSCPICSAEFTETQGEAEIRRWLLKHDIINFKQDEVTLPNENPKCKRQYLRPDFWLPDYNLFIEYNGEQHYEDVDYFFDEDFTFEDQQIRDQTLRDYCRKNNIQLLEIPYTEFDKISEILTNTLLRPKAKG